MSLSTLNNLKTTLGISLSDSSQDTALTKAWNAADAAVKSYCKRRLESQTYTWFLCGSGRPELVLPERPVSSITTVHLDLTGYYGKRAGAFASSTLLTEGMDYVLQYDDQVGAVSKSGLLLRIGGGTQAANSYPGWQNADANGGPRGTLTASLAPYWPKGLGNLKVVAVAGFTSIPADIVQAVDMLGAWLYLNAPRGGIGIQGEGYEEYSYTLAMGALYRPGGDPEIGTIAGLLSSYREYTI